MMYCLDTNVIIDATNNKKNMSAVLSHFYNISAQEIIVPSIVVAELEYGARHSSNYERNMSVSKEFISSFRIVPFTEKESEIYGKIKHQLALTGALIGSNDMLIASVALSHNATIVTHNVREFSRVQGLKVEDWTEQKRVSVL